MIGFSIFRANTYCADTEGGLARMGLCLHHFYLNLLQLWVRELSLVSGGMAL